MIHGNWNGNLGTVATVDPSDMSNYAHDPVKLAEAKLMAALEKLSFEQVVGLVQKAYAIYFATHASPKEVATSAKNIEEGIAKAVTLAKGSKTAFLSMVDDVPDLTVFTAMVMEEAAKPNTVLQKKPEPVRAPDKSPMLMYLAFGALGIFALSLLKK